MATVFEQRFSARAVPALNREFAVSVVYERGADRVTLTARRGRTEFEETVEDQIVHRLSSGDYIIVAADLILDSVLTTPLAGDRIIETQGNLKSIYGVLAPDGEPPWQYHGADQAELLVHTKLIDTEDLS